MLTYCNQTKLLHGKPHRVDNICLKVNRCSNKRNSWSTKIHHSLSLCTRNTFKNMKRFIRIDYELGTASLHQGKL